MARIVRPTQPIRPAQQAPVTPRIGAPANPFAPRQPRQGMPMQGPQPGQSPPIQGNPPAGQGMPMQGILGQLGANPVRPTMPQGSGRMRGMLSSPLIPNGALSGTPPDINTLLAQLLRR